MSRIISVSNNVRLLINRNDALALAGYSVVSPRTPQDTLLLLRRERADAVILGHSIPADERQELIAAIRAAGPGLPVVFVYQGPDGGPEPLADVSLDVTESPNPLIEYLAARLASRPLATAE